MENSKCSHTLIYRDILKIQTPFFLTFKELSNKISFVFISWKIKKLEKAP